MSILKNRNATTNANEFYRVACLAILLFVFAMFRQTGDLSGYVSQEVKLATSRAPTLTETDFSSTDLGVVFAMIAFGEAVNTEIVERAVESIRGPGNHKGYILLITDAPQNHYSRDDDPNLLVFTAVMPYIATQAEDEKKHMSLKMHYKRFKSRITEIMDEFPQLNGMESIVYMDIDIVVGRDLQPFLQYTAESTRAIVESPQFKQEPAPFLQLFPEVLPKKSKEDFHSGVMVMHRKYADGCLQAWQSLIDTEAFRRDQEALTQVARHMELYNCTIYAMPREPFILFPRKQDMKQGYAKTFVHVTGYRSGKIMDDVQEAYFRDTIGVKHLAIQDVDAF